MTIQPFNPPPEDVPRILDDLASPECSLREIAEAYDTTIDGLTLWLARPDIAERFAAAESFAARRVRHAAACQLPAAVRAATHILDLFNNAAERRQLDDLTPAIQSNSAHAAAGLTNSLPPRLAALELQRRICETARKAANLLARLARFEHGPPRPRPTPSTDHAAPTRDPSPAPKPAPAHQPDTPAPATHTAHAPHHHPTPTAPASASEPAPPSIFPLCDLRASARNSSEAPSNHAPSQAARTAPPPTALNTIANPRSSALGPRNHANPSAAAHLLHAGAPARPP